MNARPQRNTRASDPGKRLFQYVPPWQHSWVSCPRCGGPAKDTRTRLVCKRCSFTYGAKEGRLKRNSRVRLKARRPRCANRSCRAPISEYGRTRGRNDEGEVSARVRCETCGQTHAYPAHDFGKITLFAGSFGFPMRLPPFLWRDIGVGTVWAYNKEHLDALEYWLGAKLRERGDTAGLTMMARLPKWLKAASNRPRVMRALAEMREELEAEGLD